MASDDESSSTGAAPDEWFTTTHWTMVLEARDPESAQASAALEKLCTTYWYPLYVFIRRLGNDEASAKDLTQGFFARFLEKDYLRQVQREKGRFRSFLLGSLKHFLADEWDKARALKRGGGKLLFSLDDADAEERYHFEPADTMTADKLFDRRWALTLLDQARARLRAEYVQEGKGNLYDRLKVFETGDPDAPAYAAVAAEFGLTENGVKAVVHRMRERYRQLIRHEVAHTVARRAEVDEEIRYLISVISG